MRQWYIGAMNNGSLYVTDASLGAVRMQCDSGGNWYIAGAGVTVQTNLAVTGWLSGSSYIQGSGDLGVRCVSPGGTARFYSYGGHIWYFGCDSAGNFLFNNASTGAQFYLDPSANLHAGVVFSGYMDLSNGVGIGFAQQGGASRK